MKYIFSNGLKLEVREIGEIIYQLGLKDRQNPLPIINKIVSDDEARKILEDVKNTGYYRRMK